MLYCLSLDNPTLASGHVEGSFVSMSRVCSLNIVYMAGIILDHNEINFTVLGEAHLVICHLVCYALEGQ